MTDKIKQIADAKRKRGWSLSEIEAYAKRKSAEYKKISEKKSGTRLSGIRDQKTH